MALDVALRIDCGAASGARCRSHRIILFIRLASRGPEVARGVCAGPASPPFRVSVSHTQPAHQATIMSDRDRSSPSLTDTPLKTYIGRHDDDYPLINGNGESGSC